MTGTSLFQFNWLPATYAHPDWLGDWREYVPRGVTLEARLAARVSRAMLEQHDLLQRHVRDTLPYAWVAAEPGVVRACAHRLGIAMLGGVVRRRIDRRAVHVLDTLLGAGGREQALNDVHSYPALAQPDAAWPLRLRASWAATALGASMMAMLLERAVTGARDRFSLRFPRGFIEPLQVTTRQREEALSLLDQAMTGAMTSSSQASASAESS